MLWIITAVSGLRFDIAATHGEGTLKCLEQFVAKNTHVQGFVESASVSGQVLSAKALHGSTAVWDKPSIDGKIQYSFTTHEDANIKFCFTNVLDKGIQPGASVKRDVYWRLDQDVDLDHVTKDDSKFKSLSMELTSVQQVALEVIRDMDYLEKLDDQMFAKNLTILSGAGFYSTLGLFILAAVAGFQVWFLQRFFKLKHLI